MKLTRKQFAQIQLTRAIERHGDQYDYSQFIETYVGAGRKVTVLCRKHGAFYPRVVSHTNGEHCPLCHPVVSYSVVEKGFINLHGRRYWYDATSWKGMDVPMRIKCRHHGWFTLTPTRHGLGEGCPDCN